MKHFLFDILRYGLLFLALLLAIDILVSTGLRKMEDYRFQTMNEVMEGGLDYDILVMGNSRALYHFNPFIIDSLTDLTSYNLGIGGYPFNGQFIRWQLYQKYNKKPLYIIQNVDFLTFDYQMINNQHESEQFLPYMYNPFYNKLMGKYGYGWADRFFPMYRYLGYQQVIKNGILESLQLKHYVNQSTYKGFLYSNGEWDPTNLRSMKPFSAYMDPRALQLFEHFLQDCKNDSIKVILVHTPLYYEAKEKCITMDSLNNYIDSLSHTYNIPYLNYSEDYDICFDSLNFVVSVHMNHRATDQFSSDFSRDLKKYISD